MIVKLGFKKTTLCCLQETHLKYVWLCLTLYDPMDMVHQAPLSMGILQAKTLKPCPPAGDLPHPGIKPRFLTL